MLEYDVHGESNPELFYALIERDTRRLGARRLGEFLKGLFFFYAVPNGAGGKRARLLMEFRTRREFRTPALLELMQLVLIDAGTEYPLKNYFQASLIARQLFPALLTKEGAEFSRNYPNYLYRVLNPNRDELCRVKEEVLDHPYKKRSLWLPIPPEFNL